MQPAEKISITLPAEMVRVIREKVSAGGYSSNSEVIREALRCWMECERRLEKLDSVIVSDVADADVGQVEDLDTLRGEQRERVKTLTSDSIAHLPEKTQQAIRLLEEWMNDPDPGYGEESWEQLKTALDTNRLSLRRIFLE